MASNPRHAARFALFAALVGLAWYAFVIGVARLSVHQWSDLRHAPRPWIALCFALAIPLASWPFRRRIATASLRASFPMAALGLLLGTLTFVSLYFTSIYLFGGSVEEVRVESTLGGKLLWSVICVLGVTAMGIGEAAKNAYLVLPLAWGSLLTLRWASGGPAARPRGERLPSAPELEPRAPPKGLQD